MAIDKGNIKTSANYDVKAQKPLDGRAVRPAKADLIKKESWSSDGSTVYVYEGMQVYVQDEKKTYYLKDLTKMFASDFSGWELMGTGAGGSITEEKEVYIGSEEPSDAKLWVDTDEEDEPSQPSAGVWNGGIYFLPMGAAEALHNIDTYIFSDEEAQEFRRMMKNYSSTIIAIRHYDDRGTLFITPAMEVLFHSIDPIDIEVNVPSEARLISYIDQNGFYYIWEDVEDGKIKVSC